MAQDIQTMAAVIQNAAKPTVRFFQFAQPTVSFGRLQEPAHIQKNIPDGWAAVQRPTAGGMVFHDNDQCFSLCWQPGTVSMPRLPRDIYKWIHGQVLQALSSFDTFRLNPCCAKSQTLSHNQRQCFTDPVADDVMLGDLKAVGGAMAFKKNVVLYQGSIQTPLPRAEISARLKTVFAQTLP